MKTIRLGARKTETITTVPRAITPLRLLRRFIETGDERCPLAGLWTEVVHSEPLDDDSEIAMPAWDFFFRRAFTLS